jgi:hypothetical protein
MSTFLYRCPRTGATVSGWQADPPPAPASDDAPPRQLLYVAERCPACGELHIVNPATGRLLSEESESALRQIKAPAPHAPLHS